MKMKKMGINTEKISFNSKSEMTTSQPVNKPIERPAFKKSAVGRPPMAASTLNNPKSTTRKLSATKRGMTKQVQSHSTSNIH